MKWTAWPAKANCSAVSCLYDPAGRFSPTGWVMAWRGVVLTFDMSNYEIREMHIEPEELRQWREWIHEHRNEVAGQLEFLPGNRLRLRAQPSEPSSKPCTATSSEISNGMAHTHPSYCYEHNGAKQGWPSGQDLATMKEHGLTFHTVIAREGLYLVYQTLCPHKKILDVPALSSKTSARWDYIWKVGRHTCFHIMFVPIEQVLTGRFHMFVEKNIS